jgi:hypothetical protein
MFDADGRNSVQQSQYLMPPPFRWRISERQAWYGIGILLGLLILTRFIAPWPSGLWLDETTTHWLSKEGPSKIISRGAQWGNDEPLLYGLIAWLAEAIGGVNEIAIRTPSVIAMALAVWVVYLLGKRLIDRDAGIIAAIIFICLPNVMFAAIDARPYACGLLALAAAALFLIRWLDGGPAWNVFLAAFIGASVPYFQFLLIVGLGPICLYALLRAKDLNPSRRWIGVAALLLLAALVAPLGVQLLWLTANAAKISFADAPTRSSLFEFLLPLPYVPAMLFFPALIGFRVLTPDPDRPRTSATTVIFLIVWALTPILGFYEISRLTPVVVFVPRYLLPAAPGMALTAAWVLRGLGPRTGRLLAICPLLLFSLRDPRHVFHEERLREALARVRAEAAANPSLPIVIQSGFTESRDPLREPDLRNRESYLMSPLSFYPVVGKIIPIPVEATGSHDPLVAEYMQRSGISSELQNSREFLLLERPQSDFETWPKGRVPGVWTAESLGDFPEYGLYRYRRVPAPN